MLDIGLLIIISSSSKLPFYGYKIHKIILCSDFFPEFSEEKSITFPFYSASNFKDIKINSINTIKS